jgi:hypothetical protein
MNNPTLFIANADMSSWELTRYSLRDRVILHIVCEGVAYRMHTYNKTHSEFIKFVELLGGKVKCVIGDKETLFESNVDFNTFLIDTTPNPVLMWAVTHRIKVFPLSERMKCGHIQNKWSSSTLRKWFKHPDNKVGNTLIY